MSGVFIYKGLGMLGLGPVTPPAVPKMRVQQQHLGVVPPVVGGEVPVVAVPAAGGAPVQGVPEGVVPPVGI
jgi:hypothetical protein